MFEIYDIAIIPLILAIVELFKKGGLPAKFSPFLSVFLGIVVGLTYLEVPVKEGIILGLVIGLSASGLYSSGKSIVEKE